MAISRVANTGSGRRKLEEEQNGRISHKTSLSSHLPVICEHSVAIMSSAIIKKYHKDCTRHYPLRLAVTIVRKKIFLAIGIAR